MTMRPGLGEGERQGNYAILKNVKGFRTYGLMLIRLKENYGIIISFCTFPHRITSALVVSLFCNKEIMI